MATTELESRCAMLNQAKRIAFCEGVAKLGEVLRACIGYLLHKNFSCALLFVYNEPLRSRMFLGLVFGESDL